MGLVIESIQLEAGERRRGAGAAGCTGSDTAPFSVTVKLQFVTISLNYINQPFDRADRRFSLL
jgi:hypothetical protein